MLRRPNLSIELIGQGHHRVIIYINFVELESSMLHDKCHIHRTSGSREENFKVFFSIIFIWAWWSSWSCDLHHLYKLSFPLHQWTPYEI